MLIRTVNKTIFNNFLFLLLLLLPLQLLPNSNVANIFVSVFVSVIANGIVIFVMSFRRKKIRTIHILFLFMAISDILFSLAIHSMLIATSFGSNPVPLFGKVGEILFFSLLFFPFLSFSFLSFSFLFFPFLSFSFLFFSFLFFSFLFFSFLFFSFLFFSFLFFSFLFFCVSRFSQSLSHEGRRSE